MKNTLIWRILTQKHKPIEGIISQTISINMKKFKRAYERRISDIENEIEDKESTKTHLDLAISNYFLDKEFAQIAENFIQNQLNLDIEIKNLKAKLELVKAQYEYYLNEIKKEE